MAINMVEIRVKGKNRLVPSADIDGRPVIVNGGWVKIARIRDEEFSQAPPVSDPAALMAGLKRSGLRADVLTFLQQPPAVQPRFSFPIEWENYAAVPVTTFDDWWNKLPQESRKNTRRAAKRGVEVKVTPFDDELARGIHKICNETPVRQGRPFWHYGKDFAAIKREHATYVECSDFIGAYFEGELIGFIKIVYVGRLASLMAILALNAHYDKRPMNALLAKAMEICAQKGVAYFIYGNYVYGNKKDSSLVEFKRRNGFEQLDFPRYYIPLTVKGKIYVALRLYRGAVGLIPAPVLRVLLKCRDWFYARRPPGPKPEVIQDEARLTA
ncbi:MAG TPA: hypothetical protein VF988_02090 [Verrucomicrobiae bacterium]